MANCSDNVYVIKYTDKSKGTISISKSALVSDLVDITLVGKSRLDYGEVFNENMLHLLENFACPASAGNVDAPDTLVAFGTLLRNPIDGQKWFNSTNKRLYVYNSTELAWKPLGAQGDVVGNSGVIAHGSYIPRPVSPEGYVFPYSECSFVVSQHSGQSVSTDGVLPTDTEIDYMQCFVSSDGQVTMQFRYRGESSLRNGYVNYKILGIRNESNAPFVQVTPYPIPDPTPNISATPTPTPTPTPSATPSMPVSPTRTPVPTVSVTPTRTVTPTPTHTVSKTPAPSPTPSKSMRYTINLSGVPGNIDAVNAFTPATAKLVFKSDGTFVAYNKGATIASGVYLSSGVGSNYELYYTQTGNSPSAGPGAGVWHSLASAITFQVSDSSQDTYAYETINYTIRRKAATADSRSSVISLSADGGCFAVGTQLAVPSGLARVEDLVAGDTVVSFTHDGMVDESVDGWNKWTTTDNNFVLTTSTVKTAYRFTADGAMNINGLVTTMDHVYLVFDGSVYGWKNASKIVETDKLVDSDGNLVDILNITVLTGPREFVALDVETVDTLVVSDNGKLILAHNQSA